MLGPLKAQFRFLLCAAGVFIFLFIAFTNYKAPVVNRSWSSPVFQAFFECAEPNLLPLKGNYEKFWQQFVNLTLICDNLDVYKSMNIKSVHNQDEIKWVLSPIKYHQLTMVTLGIGHDTKGEETLKTMYPRTEFFGADPSQEINEDLYSKFGTYFPVAIGADAGMQKSHVFRDNYTNEVTMHIGAGYFFDEMLKKKRIDILWIDTEGNEYPLLEILHRDGELDRRGVRVCQMNIEFHLNTLKDFNDERRLFHDFVWRILQDGKYVMMKPVNVYNGFIRTFLVNVQDPECTGLYLEI